MVIDSSALVALLEREPEEGAFLELIEAADTRRMSVANFIEAPILADDRRGSAGVAVLDQFVLSAGIELMSVDLEQARAARTAFSRFGEGRHRAGLNYGDCFAYALAKTLGEPLLCKGNDFALTDANLVSYSL